MTDRETLSKHATNYRMANQNGVGGASVTPRRWSTLLTPAQDTWPAEKKSTTNDAPTGPSNDAVKT